MVQFHYTAEKSEGGIYRGVVEAPDRFSLYEMVRRDGGRIISVTQEKKNNYFSFAYWNAKISTVPRHEISMFTRNLAAMLTAGLSLARGLSVSERQTRNAKLSQMLALIEGEVREGKQFNESLKQFPETFPPIFVAMVKTGEESGDLPNALNLLAAQIERADTLRKSIRSALIYPAIIVVAIIGIGYLMLTQVVPTLAQTFEELGSELPATTQAIITISDFLVSNTLLALTLFVALVGGVILGVRSRQGKRAVDFVILALPLIGNISREVNAARTARTLNSMLSSGVDIISSLEITQDVVQNTYFKDVLRESQADIQKGLPLSRVFTKNEKLYPPLVGEMIAVGEETGQLAEMLLRLAEFYEEEVTRKTKDMSTVIEPFLMVIIGGAVGFFALSMIAPIYELSDTL